MKKETKSLKYLTTNLHNMKNLPVEDTDIAKKFVKIQKYNSSICSVFSPFKPISKIINKSAD